MVPEGVGTPGPPGTKPVMDPHGSGGWWPAGCLFNLWGHFAVGFFSFAMEGEAGGGIFKLFSPGYPSYA